MLSRSWSYRVFLTATLAFADTIPVCSVWKESDSASLQTAPLPLLQALSERVGELAPPDVAFDATDVVVTGRNRRLICYGISAEGGSWRLSMEVAVTTIQYLHTISVKIIEV